MSNQKWRILVVDDEPNNLHLMMQVLGDKYQMAYATSGKEALDIVVKMKPDLILLDIMMPEMDGYETCRKLKADPYISKIPVIFVTAMGKEEHESLGFEVGGVDYVTKPVSVPVVLARVATHLALYNQQRACEITVLERTAELEASQHSAIHMLGEAGHYNDTDTGVHIWRMAAFAGAIARAHGWRAEQAEMLELAAPMHDTGKIGIPDAILKKPGKLDAEEWQIMKNHSRIGHGILCKCDTPLFRMAADIALYHHEKWDGGGYPEGLKGDQIPESARIVALADVFDALTMKRSYKDAWPLDKALKEIRDTTGSHFDPFLVESFFSIQNEIMEIKDTWNRKELS
ncbi:response regulator [Desulfobacterales bacterium HSG16]|nr:response regulator [Desulfobacterales bacterium HSG16]